MSKTAMPKTCVVCGNPLSGRQRLYCSKCRGQTLYTHTCQCGCGQTFTSHQKVQKYKNAKHMGIARKRKGTYKGKNNPNWKSGVYKNTNRKTYSKNYYEQVVKNQKRVCPTCKQLVPMAKGQKFCSLPCFAGSRKRDKLGRWI